MPGAPLASLFCKWDQEARAQEEASLFLAQTFTPSKAAPGKTQIRRGAESLFRALPCTLRRVCKRPKPMSNCPCLPLLPQGCTVCDVYPLEVGRWPSVTCLPQEKPDATVPFGAKFEPRGAGPGRQQEEELPASPGAQGFKLTIIQRPLQDGRVAGAAVPDAREGQHLDLVEHVFAQARELGAAGRVPFHQPEPGLGIRVLLLIYHLPEHSTGSEGLGSGSCLPAPFPSPIPGARRQE